MDSGGQFARAVSSPDGALAGGEPGGYLRPLAAGTRRSLLSLGVRTLRVGDRGVDLVHWAGEFAGRLGFDVRLPADVGLIGQFRIVLGALVLPGSASGGIFISLSHTAAYCQVVHLNPHVVSYISGENREDRPNRLRVALERRLLTVRHRSSTATRATPLSRANGQKSKSVPPHCLHLSGADGLPGSRASSGSRISARNSCPQRRQRATIVLIRPPSRPPYNMLMFGQGDERDTLLIDRAAAAEVPGEDSVREWARDKRAFISSVMEELRQSEWQRLKAFAPWALDP